jgi:hypothetical protein
MRNREGERGERSGGCASAGIGRFGGCPDPAGRRDRVVSTELQAARDRAMAQARQARERHEASPEVCASMVRLWVRLARLAHHRFLRQKRVSRATQSTPGDRFQ